MPCYHPLIRYEDLTKWELAKDGHRYHPAEVITKDSPDYIEKEKKYISGHYKRIIIPCHNCIGCELENSRQWANRGYLEKMMTKDQQAWFVTLTYDDDHLLKPDEIVTKDGFSFTNDGSWEGGTLVPKHVETFINTLRKIYEREHNHTGIRFMMCGEYGDQGARPHYHFILFNMPINAKKDLYEPRIINKNFYWRSKTIERAWTKGISNICEATWNTIAYTARYITKKINGNGSEYLYAANGKIKEFMRVSTNPGIGYNYYEAHKEDIYARDEITIKNASGICHCKPPRYFDELYKKENPEHFKQIQQKRQKDALNGNRLKKQTTSQFLAEQLEIEERLKDEETAKLIRAMEKSTR